MKRLALALAAAAVIGNASADSSVTCTFYSCAVVTEPPVNVGPMLNDWGNGAQAFGIPATFYKDIGGVVHLQGLIYKWGASTYNEPAFALPLGYRPAQEERIPIVISGQPGFAFIGTNGDVWISGPAGMWASLSGITFRAQ